MKKLGLNIIAVFALFAWPVFSQNVDEYLLASSGLTVGQGWKTRVIVENPTSQSRYIAVNFRRGNGERLENFYVNGDRTYGTNWTLAPGERKYFTAYRWPDGPIETGTVFVIEFTNAFKTPPTVVGWVERYYELDGRFVSYTNELARPLQHTRVWACSNTDLETGVAFSNLTSHEKRVMVRTYDGFGKLVAQTQVALQSGDQVSRFLWEIFADEPGWQAHIESNNGFLGQLEIETDSPALSVLTINFSMFAKEGL